MSQARPSLVRQPDFVKLWAAASVSLLGTQISLIAIPVIAVVLLGAPPFQVALLGTIEFLPFLLFTLPAGVWVDRLPRRHVLIVGDVGRAIMLASIPVAYAFGALTIWQLYVVGFVNGIMTVLFDIADMSYLPTIVERDQLVEGNAKLQASFSLAQVIGQPVGGGVVGLLSAPRAVLLDAISFVVSAVLILAIRRREHSAQPTTAEAAPDGQVADLAGRGISAQVEAAVTADPPTSRSVRREVADGLRFVVGNRYLRPISATTGSSNLFNNILFGVYPVFAYRDLGLSPEVVGLIGGSFGIGALVGAMVASRVAAVIGVGPAIIASAAINAPAALLIPISTTETALVLMSIGGFVSGWANVVYNVNQVSLRQTITPERMLGRMNATMRFIVWGTIPIGQIVGGLLATVFSTVVAIWVGAIGGLFAFLPTFFSPVRPLRKIPEVDEGAATSPA